MLVAVVEPFPATESLRSSVTLYLFTFHSAVIVESLAPNVNVYAPLSSCARLPFPIEAVFQPVNEYPSLVGVSTAYVLPYVCVTSVSDPYTP